MPFRATAQAAGYDLCCTEDFQLVPFVPKAVGTGIKIKFNEKTYGQIAARSGRALKQSVMPIAGVLDIDYEKEIKVIMLNFGQNIAKFRAKERIAQLLIIRISHPTLTCAEDIEQLIAKSDKRRDGFGSTGI